MISLPSLHLRFSLVQSEPIVTSAEHSCATSAQKFPAALCFICCCCWEIRTVNGIAAKIRKSTITAVVREWVGDLTKSKAFFKKPIVDLE